MTAIVIILGHDVEEKWFYIIVQGLRAKKELCEKTEVLTVNGIFPTVNFKKGVFSVPVYFIARRVLCWAFELARD